MKHDRMIAYIPEGSFKLGFGHRVSFVKENESGHFPSGGADQAPWYWGNNKNEKTSLEEAKKAAEEYNKRLGITPEAAADVLASSMAASFRKG